MSPKGSHHELVKSAVNFQWGRVCPETCRLIGETTFRVRDDTYFEPDYVIYSVEPGLLALSPQNVLLVVEIADTSLRYDRGRKAGLYALFGVRELWVIDAVKLTTRVFRRRTRMATVRGVTSAPPSAWSHSSRPRSSPWRSMN